MTCFVFDAWYAGFIYLVNPQKPEIRFVNLIKTEWWRLANKYQVTILDQTNLC